MAGKKTSVYLDEQLKAAVEASGASLPDLIRRGLAAGQPEPLEDRLGRTITAAVADLEDTLTRAVSDAIRNAIADQRYT